MASAIDLYRQAQQGDQTAFYSWADGIQPDMGRFAYQLGVPVEELPTFQQRCLQQLSGQLMQYTPGQAKIQLYRLVVQQAPEQAHQRDGSGRRLVLGFEEDQELHVELQKLAMDQRVLLALTHFHSSPIADIMMIIEKSEQQVIQSIDEGAQILQHNLQLDEGQMIQRLAMLQKSYQRFIPPIALKEEIQNPDEIIPAPQVVRHGAPAPPFGKKPAIALGAASLFLAAVIGISFSVNDQQAKTAGTTEWQQVERVTDDMIADWRSQYEMIKETSPERLGMSPQQYAQLDYVKQADAEMERVFSDETLDSLEEEPVEMQMEVDRLLRQAETPRGMVNSISGTAPASAADMESFLRNYAVKTDELRQFADNVLLKYRQELESTLVMNQLSPEKLLAQSDSYPEELRMVVEALPEYNLFAVAHPNDKRFRTIRDVNIINQQQPVMDDPYAWQYLNLLGNEPYFDGSGFLMPIENVPQHLISMELALLEEGDETSLFEEVEVAYQQTFWELVKGSGNAPVFDDQGKVKVEYRSAWNGLASSNPMAFLMLPILEEMEASGWTASVHYDELQFHDLLDALAMEKSGELADKLPNGNLMIEDEFVDMRDFDYIRIKPLYESFKTSYDLQLLAGVPPLDVLFMYHYANEIDDRDTLWHLLADSPLKPTLEAFKEQWRNIPKLTEKVAWVELSKESFKQRVKEKIYIYPQIQADDYDERLELMLVTEKDRIWQIDYQQYESYDLLGEDQQFKKIVDSLYKAISGESENQLPEGTEPGEVAGVFFKAIENRDIPTMKKLMAETDWADEEFEYFLELHSFRPFSELAQLTFKTFFSPDNSTNITGRAEIQYESGPQDSLFEEVFFMEKTVDGWRMSSLDGY